MAEVLKTAGYNTYGVGKWHVGDHLDPIDRGFDAYYGFIKGHSAPQWERDRYHRYPESQPPERSFSPDAFYATDAFSDYAIAFIDQAQRKDAPWFLYLAHSAPHFPYTHPRKPGIRISIFTAAVGMCCAENAMNAKNNPVWQPRTGNSRRVLSCPEKKTTR